MYNECMLCGWNFGRNRGNASHNSIEVGVCAECRSGLTPSCLPPKQLSLFYKKYIEKYYGE